MTKNDRTIKKLLICVSLLSGFALFFSMFDEPFDFKKYFVPGVILTGIAFAVFFTVAILFVFDTVYLERKYHFSKIRVTEQAALTTTNPKDIRFYSTHALAYYRKIAAMNIHASADIHQRLAFDENKDVACSVRYISLLTKRI